MFDEILIQEAREQLRDMDLDEFSIEESIERMRDAGLFDMPEDWS